MNISLCTQFDEALCSLFSLAFKVYSTEAPRLTRVGTFTRSTVAGGGYFRTLHQKSGRERGVGSVHVCQKFISKGQRETKRSRLLFSPGARGSGWFWGCASEPSWCFSPSCCTAQRGAGTVTDPTPFCRRGKKKEARSVKTLCCKLWDVFVFCVWICSANKVPSMWYWICFGKSFADSHKSKWVFCTKKVVILKKVHETLCWNVLN